MIAAEKGHLEVLNKLIQSGANVHIKNEVCHSTILQQECVILLEYSYTVVPEML